MPPYVTPSDIARWRQIRSDVVAQPVQARRDHHQRLAVRRVHRAQIQPDRHLLKIIDEHPGLPATSAAGLTCPAEAPAWCTRSPAGARMHPAAGHP